GVRRCHRHRTPTPDPEQGVRRDRTNTNGPQILRLRPGGRPAFCPPQRRGDAGAGDELGRAGGQGHGRRI
ncbi:MAG: hypothetical protein AVDCRST_MAG73-1741, partial [uncultured Thermomicrobiales bacterium]